MLNVTDDAGNIASNIASITINEPEIVVEQSLADYLDETFLVISILFLAWAIIRSLKRPPSNKQEGEE